VQREFLAKEVSKSKRSFILRAPFPLFSAVQKKDIAMKMESAFGAIFRFIF